MSQTHFRDVLDALGRTQTDVGRPSRTLFKEAFILERNTNGGNGFEPDASHLVDALYFNDLAAAAPKAGLGQSISDWVADELRLRPGMTAQELHRLRREFARLHHPDCVPADAREQATRRMTIANMMIDRALANAAG